MRKCQQCGEIVVGRRCDNCGSRQVPKEKHEKDKPRRGNRHRRPNEDSDEDAE